MEEIRLLTATIDQLEEKEELFWRQRSRVKWLTEGDSNSHFLHQTTIQRRRFNKIEKLLDDGGVWRDDCASINQVIYEHFSRLFKTGGLRDWENVLDCVQPAVSNEMNAHLMGPVTLEEVKNVIFQMGGMKTPGPDGFQGVFYHSYWDIILEDVNGLIKDFACGRMSSKNINSTHIVLIPNAANPSSMSQFRPISLCNYSYKIFLKLLANRLKGWLPKIISPYQNAFVEGRLIQDNIPVTHEVFHFLKLRKVKTQFELALKIDMNKTYDCIEWDILETIMVQMGFHRWW